MSPPYFALFLSVHFVGDGQFLTTFSAAGSQDATAISGLHTLTETVLVVSLSVVRLKCSFHCCYAVLFLFVELRPPPSLRTSVHIGLQS